MQHVDRCCSLADTDTKPQGAGAGAGHRAKAKSCRIVAIQQCVVQQEGLGKKRAMRAYWSQIWAR